MVLVWMTFSDLWPTFQGHDIIQRQITQKRYKIELYLQWQTNTFLISFFIFYAFYVL